MTERVEQLNPTGGRVFIPGLGYVFLMVNGLWLVEGGSPADRQSVLNLACNTIAEQDRRSVEQQNQIHELREALKAERAKASHARINGGTRSLYEAGEILAEYAGPGDEKVLYNLELLVRWARQAWPRVQRAAAFGQWAEVAIERERLSLALYRLAVLAIRARHDHKFFTVLDLGEE